MKMTGTWVRRGSTIELLDGDPPTRSTREFGEEEQFLPPSSLLGNAEISLRLYDRLGGGTHRVTYRTEDPPPTIETYPYERVAMQIFKSMEVDGPYNVATKIKGKWVRFDVDVGWLFWMRVANGRAELKLSPETRATFGEILRRLQQPGAAPIAVELPDAPQASTSQSRVFFWLIKNISGIVATEQKYSIDRRAIAGAIAWEALQNVWPGPVDDLATSSGAAKFSGPGKVHYKEGRLKEGITAAIEIEQRGRLPVQTMERRREILATTSGALSYIGAIMREFSDVAAQSGYYLDCDPPMLATFYNAWNINQAEPLFAKRRAPMPLTPNDKMGAWIGAKANMTFIERAVGKPPTGFCKKLRGY